MKNQEELKKEIYAYGSKLTPAHQETLLVISSSVKTKKVLATMVGNKDQQIDAIMNAMQRDEDVKMAIITAVGAYFGDVTIKATKTKTKVKPKTKKG